MGDEFRLARYYVRPAAFGDGQVFHVLKVGQDCLAGVVGFGAAGFLGQTVQPFFNCGSEAYRKHCYTCIAQVGCKSLGKMKHRPVKCYGCAAAARTISWLLLVKKFRHHKHALAFGTAHCGIVAIDIENFRLRAGHRP